MAGWMVCRVSQMEGVPEYDAHAAPCFRACRARVKRRLEDRLDSDR